MRIDVHSHFLPPRFFQEMTRLDAENRVEAFSIYGPMLGASARSHFAGGERHFIESMIRQMDACDVDVAVLSMGAVQPYFPDAPTATSAARFANDMLASAIAASGGRLAAFGTVPLPHTAAAVQEMHYCLDSLGFAGISLGCSAGDLPLDDPHFDDLWAAADERSTAVFLHPGSTPRIAVGASDYHLAPDFCSPTEMSVALCRLVIGKVTIRYPNVGYIAGTMGGTLPYLARRFDRGLSQSHPDLYEELGGVLGQLQRFWYDTSMTEDPQLLDVARNSVGVDRLMLGSDVPRGPLIDAVDFIDKSDRLSAEEKFHILDGNAAELLRLPTPVGRAS